MAEGIFSLVMLLILLGGLIYVAIDDRSVFVGFVALALFLYLVFGFVEASAQEYSSIKTDTAKEIIRVSQMNYDPDILKMNPLSMETHEQVRYKRAVEAEQDRESLVKGLLDLYEMRLLGRQCTQCNFHHGRFYHQMQEPVKKREPTNLEKLKEKLRQRAKENRRFFDSMYGDGPYSDLMQLREGIWFLNVGVYGNKWIRIDQMNLADWAQWLDDFDKLKRAQ
ncbi:MAG: hypothetical protein ABIG63_04595 [Chloroflexota bacterium]